MAAQIKNKKKNQTQVPVSVPEKPRSVASIAGENDAKLSVYVKTFRDLVDVCGLIAYCQSRQKRNEIYYEGQIQELRTKAMAIALSLQKACEPFGWMTSRRDVLINRLIKEKYRREVYRYYLDNYKRQNSVIDPGEIEWRYRVLDKKKKAREKARLKKKNTKKEPEILKIYRELFEGTDSALAKYSRVRKCKSELDLRYNPEEGCSKLPLEKISNANRKYFSVRFLKIEWLDEDFEGYHEAELKKGLEALGYANESCNKRCTKLILRLNEELEKHGKKAVRVDDFLDWATFCTDDALNRKFFFEEAKLSIEKHQLLNPGELGKIAEYKKTATKI